MVSMYFFNGNFGPESFMTRRRGFYKCVIVNIVIAIVCCRILTLCFGIHQNPSQLWRYPHPCWNLHLMDLSIQPFFVICGNNVSCLQIRLQLCFARCDALFQSFQALLEDVDHWWRCLFTNFQWQFSLQLKSLHNKLYLMSQICPNSLKKFTVF